MERAIIIGIVFVSVGIAIQTGFRSGGGDIGPSALSNPHKIYMSRQDTPISARHAVRSETVFKY